MSERKLRRFDKEIRDRLRIICLACGIPAEDFPAHQGLRTLLRRDEYTIFTRASLSLLAATGRYPTEQAASDLASLVALSQDELAWTELVRAVSKSSKRSLTRQLRPSLDLVVDVSRTSRATHTTGIPRVALAVASIAQQAGASLVVWEDGAPGRVQLSDSRVEFPADEWHKASHRRRRLTKVKSLYWKVLERMSRLPGGATFQTLARSIASPVANVLFGRDGPRQALLLSNCRYILPEVPQTTTSTSLLGWLKTDMNVQLTTALHDFLPITSPMFSAPDQRLEHIEFSRVVAASKKVVVASPHLRREVLAMRDLYQPGHLLEVEHVPYGIDALTWHEQPQPARGQPEFLMIGSMDDRKNHRLALLALADLSRQGCPTTLHVVGGPRPVSRETRQALAWARQVGVAVLEHPRATDGEIKGLMRNCVASFYLSWAEGFGLPVLESLACGLPVIASDIPSNADHCHYGGVVLVSPRDPSELAAIVGRLLDDSEYLQRLRSEIDSERLPHGFERWASALLTGDSKETLP